MERKEIKGRRRELVPAENSEKENLKCWNNIGYRLDESKKKRATPYSKKKRGYRFSVGKERCRGEKGYGRPKEKMLDPATILFQRPENRGAQANGGCPVSLL